MKDLRFGVILSDLFSASKAVRLGVLADKLGFDSIWVTDHTVDIDGARMDPWTVLAAIGVQTKNVLLSPGVTDPYRCHPSKISHIVATLDEITDGRAALGISTGEAMNLIPFGINFEEARQRLERLREAIEVVKLLWTANRKETANYNGRYYSLNQAFIDQPTTQKPHPPVYVGAFRSPTLMELTGELGDGWFPWVNTPETYSKCIESISAGARKAGRRPEEIDAATWFYSTISEDLKVQAGAVEAGKSILFLEKTILRSAGFEVTYPHYQHLLATHPFKTYAELRRAAREVPEKPVQEALMIGGPDECIEFVERFIHVGARHICFRIMSFPGSPSIEDTLKTLSQKIIPHLKENR